MASFGATPRTRVQRHIVWIDLTLDMWIQGCSDRVLYMTMEHSVDSELITKARDELIRRLERRIVMLENAHIQKHPVINEAKNNVHIIPSIKATTEEIEEANALFRIACREQAIEMAEKMLADEEAISNYPSDMDAE